MTSSAFPDPPPPKRRRPSSPPVSPPSSSPPPPPVPNPPPPSCPYLHTINRPALDFDLPPVCAVTLQSHNLYICLVCGRYLQGRAPSSPAVAHSLHARHHLFLSLATELVYCLPDDYRVHDPSLADLSAALRPRFSSAHIAALDTHPLRIHVRASSPRIRGAVPLDNLHASDYANAVFQLLLRPPHLRRVLLQHYASADAAPTAAAAAVAAPHVTSRPAAPTAATATAAPPALADELARALGHVCAKIWASNAFRSHIAPHELMQLVARTSAGRFGLLKQADPLAFAAWLLNVLAAGESVLGHVVQDLFRGEMEVLAFAEGRPVKKVITPFWYLPLDLPPKPLFKDASERTLVPQVPLEKLLRKFDGVSRHHDVKTAAQKTYRITKLPPYVLMVVRRFSKSTLTTFGVQKNPCVVHLPADGLDMSGVVGGWEGKYMLLAAVLHDGTPEDGKYRVALRHDATDTWYDLSDMTAKPTLEQLVSLADTYLLLYGPSNSINHLVPS